MIEQKDTIVLDITSEMLVRANEIMEGVDKVSDAGSYGAEPMLLKKISYKLEFKKNGRLAGYLGKAVLSDYIGRQIQIGGMANGDKYDMLISGTKVSVKTTTTKPYWQPPPLDHTVVFPNHRTDNLLGTEVFIVVCLNIDDQLLNIQGVISRERIKEIGIPCEIGEIIGAGQGYAANEAGLWMEYRELDPFVLEEWNDKVATARR